MSVGVHVKIVIAIIIVCCVNRSLLSYDWRKGFWQQQTWLFVNYCEPLKRGYQILSHATLQFTMSLSYSPVEQHSLLEQF